MRVIVTGSSGLVGQALLQKLGEAGHEALPLRRSARPGGLVWNPAEDSVDPTIFEGVDAVIHLSGENIGGGRWTETRKARIWDSRIGTTRLLCEAFAQCESPPKALLCASAMGYYGDRGDEVLSESATPGEGFLAELCTAWEASAQPARDAGIRVVHLRLGLVLTPTGGVLKQMLLPFRMGLGGRIGSGQQWMSWIALEDLVGLFVHCLEDGQVSGVVNAVAPSPVRNADFTKILGKVLRRPTFLPFPLPLARLALGKMIDELLLFSARVEPKRAVEELQFAYEHRDLQSYLSSQLG